LISLIETIVEITDLRLNFYDSDYQARKPEISTMQHTTWSNKEMDWSKKENIERELLDQEFGCTHWYKKWEDQFLDT